MEPQNAFKSYIDEGVVLLERANRAADRVADKSASEKNMLARGSLE